MESEDTTRVSVIIRVVVDRISVEHRVVTFIVETVVRAPLSLISTREVVSSVVFILVSGIRVVDRVLGVFIDRVVNSSCGRFVGLYFLHHTVHVRGEIQIIVLCRNVDKRQGGE